MRMGLKTSPSCHPQDNIMIDRHVSGRPDLCSVALSRWFLKGKHSVRGVLSGLLTSSHTDFCGNMLLLLFLLLISGPLLIFTLASSHDPWPGTFCQDSPHLYPCLISWPGTFCQDSCPPCVLVDPIVADQPDELSGVYQYVFLTIFLPLCFFKGMFVYQYASFHFKEINTIVIGFW